METGEDIEIEVLDSSEIPDSELTEFSEIQPIKIEKIKQESQEILIKKYVNGEVAFPTYYTTFDEEEDEKTLLSQQLIRSQPGTSTYLDSSQRKDKRSGRRRTVLNAALQGLMGEANLCFARGKTEITEKICLEIIRQNPLAPEPFFTLAQLYETKDPEKFLNFSTIAAHLDHSNRDQWIRIAEINIEQKNYAQARVHFSKAIRHLPKDYDLRLRKAKLLVLMGETREAMLTYLKMIPCIPPDEAKLCLATAKNVARYFHQSQKMALALEAMRGAYNTCPNLFSTEDINLLLELLMLNKNYDTVLIIFRDRCGLEVLFKESIDELFVVTCIIPKDLIPDFRVKLCVSLIHLKAFHLMEYFLRNFSVAIPPEDGVDWYMDVAEALMKENKFLETIQLLKPIVESETAPPYVWLRHAECYRSLGMVEEAIQSYYKVIEMAPFCSDAKFTLSALLKQQGRHREAIKALEQDTDDTTAINPRLFYERCLMLKAVDEIDQFIDIGYILLARHSLRFRTREEVIICSNGGHQYNPDTFKSIVESRFDEDEPIAVDQDGNNLTIDDEYELFKNIAQTAHEYGKFGMLEKLCFAILIAKRFRNKTHDMEKIIMFSSLYNNDAAVTFNFFREMLPKNIHNNSYWNFMNVIIQKSEDTRYHRYLKRTFAKQSECSPYLKILMAHYHLVAGSYKYALSFYVPILKEFNDPLSALCTAVCFNQMSLQKNSTKKPTGVGQGIAFLNLYKQLRMNSATKQEIFYNLGRLHHQSGVIHVALNYYQLALDISDPLIEENDDILGLKEEIAFNLHLIYKTAGNLQMARHVLHKYINV